MRGTRGGVRRQEPRPVLTTGDLFVALPFLLFAIFVYRGGLDSTFSSPASQSEAQLAADAAAYRLLLEQQQAGLVVAPAAPAVVLQPAPAAPVAAAAPIRIDAPAPAAPAAAKKAAEVEKRARPTPPSRPVLDDKAAPSLPPLAKDDPPKPDVPLSSATFIDGGSVNVYPHELSERAALKTLAERDWWPTVQRGWERCV